MEQDDFKQWQDEQWRLKAKALRFKKPMMSLLNLDQIAEEMEEIQSEADVIEFMDMNDREAMLSMMDDDEEELAQFQMEFSTLAEDAGHFMDDVNELRGDEGYDAMDEKPSIFDDVFSSVGRGNRQFGAMLGFDTYEHDYYGLADSWEEAHATDEADARIMKLTKKKMIETYRLCTKVVCSFLSIQDRYASLKAAYDILCGKNAEHVKAVQAMEDAYDKLEWYKGECVNSLDFDRTISHIPAEAWLY